MSAIMKQLNIKHHINNNDAVNKNIFINEGKIKELYQNEPNVKPKLVLVLDSAGGLTPIALENLETNSLSSIDELNQHLSNKFLSSNATKMPPFKFNDSLSITGMGENSCVWAYLNGRITLVCD